MRKTTLAAIAAEAGVSLPTVSKVVNGRPDVAPSTRARVEQLLVQHQYPRSGQRAARRSGLIDLVFNGPGQPVGGGDPARGRGMGRGALHRDRGVLRPARRRPAGQLDLGDRQPPLRRGDPGDHHADRARRSGSCAGPGIPLVVIDPANTPPPDIPSVGATNWAGGFAATEHLLSLGHRRIGAITGFPDMLCSLARLDGYRSALERAGFAADPALIKYGDFQHEGGFARAVELLDLPDPPTAIFAGSDQQAFGVYEAARQRGLRIPDDLSVVGFDELPVSRWASPPMTTVRQPLAEMGSAAAADARRPDRRRCRCEPTGSSCPPSCTYANRPPSLRSQASDPDTTSRPGATRRRPADERVADLLAG